MKTLSMMVCLVTSAAVAQVGYNRDTTQRAPRIAAVGAYAAVVCRSIDEAYPGSKGDIVLWNNYFYTDVLYQKMVVHADSRGEQDKPCLAMDRNRSVVVAWSSFTSADSMYDIKARIFVPAIAPTGFAAVGPEFLVNSTVANSQTDPDVAFLKGKIVVVWSSWYQDGGDRGVYAQRFDSTGAKLGTEFRVNVVTQYSQAHPVVKFFPDGKFIVAWESWGQDGSGYGVFARIFDADGTPVGGEFAVNTWTPDHQWQPSVETFSDSSFVAAWCSWSQDGSEGGIYFQRFDKTGAKAGAETRANASTAYYQWLPRVHNFSEVADGLSFGIIWSSWKQDGSREGVYFRAFDSRGNPTTFEAQVNTSTASFQWEPDFVRTPMYVMGVPYVSSGYTAVYAGWTGPTRDYDVLMHPFAPELFRGTFAQEAVNRSAGRTTSAVKVHVTNQSALTGHTYEVRVDTTGVRTAFASIRDITKDSVVVRYFPIDRGEGFQYLSPAFDGVKAEVIPEFDFQLDTDHSFFANHSGSSLRFNATAPGAGTRLLAPIDVALIWGRNDTLPNGAWAFPSDTALNSSGQRTVVVPFRAWNLTDNAPVRLLVIEASGSVNLQWNPGERIIFMTPAPYAQKSTNTHAELQTTFSGSIVTLPGPGDTNFVFTNRPLAAGDAFRFSTDAGLVLGVQNSAGLYPGSIVLDQNFPNPFNPTTAISFQLSVVSDVTLKVYDMLGREVATLVQGIRQAGRQSVTFDGERNASGVYVYRLTAGGLIQTRKMVLVK